MLEDWPALLLAGGTLLGLVLLAEVFRKYTKVSDSATRRSVHAGVGLCVAGMPFLFSGPGPVYLLAILFTLVNYVAWRVRSFPSIHAARVTSMGTVTFPLALLPALALTWSIDPERVGAMQIAFVLLALADPFASWVGSRFGEGNRFRLGGEEKSLIGSAGFFGIALLIAVGGLLLWGRDLPGEAFSGATGAIAFSVALCTTVVEALSRRGWDNFFVPLAAIVLLVFALEHPAAGGRLLGGCLAGLVFGALAYKLHFLQASGAVAGGLLAASLVGLGGWAWAVPAFTFFFLSSALSAWRADDKRHAAPQSELGSRRDAGQVFANGGVGWALLLVYVAYPHAGLYLAFLGAFAAAAADTWATEIGLLSQKAPRDLVTWKRVPPGTSGAVSVLGTAAAAAGAATVAGTAGPFWPAGIGLPLGSSIVLVALCGLIGAYADSLAGAALERRATAGATEARLRGGGAERQGGGRGAGALRLTNNQVNALGTVTGALLAMAGSYLIA